MTLGRKLLTFDSLVFYLLGVTLGNAWDVFTCLSYSYFFGLKKEHFKQMKTFYQLNRRASKESVRGKKVKELIKYPETSQKKHIAKRKALPACGIVGRPCRALVAKPNSCRGKRILRGKVILRHILQRKGLPASARYGWGPWYRDGHPKLLAWNDLGEKDREMPGHIRKKACQLQERGEAMQDDGTMMAIPSFWPGMTWVKKIDKSRDTYCKEKACQLQERGEAMQGHGPVMASPTTGLSSLTAVKASVRPTRNQTVLHRKKHTILGKYVHKIMITSTITICINHSGLTKVL